jgi:uncharacterized protein YbaR (Trm112 family)
LKKRFQITVIELWLLLIMLGSVILTLWPQLEVVKESRYRQECVANLIGIMMAIRMYEAKEGVEYTDHTIRGLVDKGYLSEELCCPASGAYYRIDPEIDLAFCPSGRPGHNWPVEE